MRYRYFRSLLVALLAVGLVILGTSVTRAQGGRAETGPVGPGAGPPAERSGMMGPHGGMTGMMGMPGGSRATVVAQHFIREMIPHHDDAVVMADLALAQAEHPELRQLAAAIKQVQTDEIALMRDWYQAWFRAPVPPSMMSGGMMGMMGGMGGHNPSTIDGARPFDKAFIEEMVPHHAMAVHMSAMTLRAAEQPELRALLQSIISSQTAEIAQMRAWYEQWYGTPLPLRSAGRH
jgi:uncharacterized protein (DUF305 family)